MTKSRKTTLIILGVILVIVIIPLAIYCYNWDEYIGEYKSYNPKVNSPLCSVEKYNCSNDSDCTPKSRREQCPGKVNGSIGFWSSDYFCGPDDYCREVAGPNSKNFAPIIACVKEGGSWVQGKSDVTWVDILLRRYRGHCSK